MHKNKYPRTRYTVKTDQLNKLIHNNNRDYSQ